MDHFIYDASLHRDWEVLVDCSRPGAPARIELTRPGTAATIPAYAGRHQDAEKAVRSPAAYRIHVKAGDAVEVFSSADDPARIMLSGIAMQSALAGQVIRVRLRASGRFVSGIVRGAHSVELAAVKRSWREP